MMNGKRRLERIGKREDKIGDYMIPGHYIFLSRCSPWATGVGDGEDVKYDSESHLTS